MTVGKAFNREHKAELRRFVYACQLHHYGDPEIEPEITVEGAKILNLQDGDYKGMEIWYGGNPFAGTLTVLYKEVPCFQMAYQGAIRNELRKADVDATLSEALQRVNVDHPWRGPAKFMGHNGLRYVNIFDGHLRNFSGKEEIYDQHKQLLYYGRYMGRIINMTP